MGQYWNLISIDNCQSTGHLGKFGEFFWYSSPILVPYLIAPVVPSTYKPESSCHETSAKINKLVSKLQSNTTSAALLALPVELLIIIAEDLGKDYLHLLCFSLTCTLLWEVTGQSRYRSLCSKLEHDSWAGSRIILLGDYAGSLPETVLTEQDKEKFTLDEVSCDELGTAFYHIAYRYFPEPLSPRTDFIFNDIRVKENRDLWEELLEAVCYDQTRFRRWMEPRRSEFMPVPQPGDRWMLRNLSKREYVTLAWTRDMDQVIYTLIARSDDPSVSMRGGDWLVKGPWAGDRIDITLVSAHEKENGDEGDWKEITAGVVSKLKALAVEDDYRGKLYLD
ncbi:hypothetical protein FB446DRAFT_747471 [Lentinula raphanica]|nr:hypothetical protein FB446DRAFT_747471 [Lentinula raphanica]KAJ3821962.1 hypothetical protein F5880DRAFT_744703 [Lentinula raphanica]